MLKDAVPLVRCRRALVIKLRHHGDVLLATPVLTALKAAAPQLEIDALVYDDTAPMLAAHPDLAQLHTVGRAWRGWGPLAHATAEWRLFSQLRARRYDLLVHLSEHPRGAWLARSLGARWRVAPRYADRGRLWSGSFSHRFALPATPRRHMVEWNLDALRRIGVQPAMEDRRVCFVPGAQAEASVQARLSASGLEPGAYLHLHPASRWRFKCWPADKVAALADRLAQDGSRIVFTAAPDREETQLVEDIVARMQAPSVNLAGQLSLKELGALAARARLFIGVDSMPMHLAAAMGVPVVALFGPSGEREWGPWSVAHEVVSSAHPCRPCGNDGCGGGKVSECLTTLEVEPVLAAARRLLEKGREVRAA
ncbi:MAG: heptosyltransferase [Betaproteobacteria bacterium SG8_39]|nr:MAG: heptosyltransferase [Betaproteobacteria bacterium SG8_39]